MPIEDERLGQAAEWNCGEVRYAADERHLHGDPQPEASIRG